MTAREAYLHFHINSGLQSHMIRVAAVAKMICDNAVSPIRVESVVSAALVHDLGNLIKAVSMEENARLYEPEGVQYWQEQQQELIAEYGADEEVATRAMIEKLGLSALTKQYYQAVGSRPTEFVCTEGCLEEKIINYSDMRVGLYGVIGLADRMADIRNRYSDRGTAVLASREAWLSQIEKDIFSNNQLAPSDITDQSTAAELEALWDWELS